jgi:putative lipoprotein
MRRLTGFLALAALTASIVACQATTPKKDRPDIPDGPPPPDMVAPTEAAAMTTITGTALYFEKIALGEGFTLRVQLVNTLLADTPTAVVADQTFPAGRGSPMPFKLAVDASKLDARMRYALSASVRGPEGKLVFVTDTAVPVDVKAAAPVEFRMKMVRN